MIEPLPPEQLAPLIRKRIGDGEFNYAYNFSLKHRYLYVENAKCACTRIKSMLGKLELGGGPDASYEKTFLQNVHVNGLGTPFVKPFQLPDAQLAEMLGGSVLRTTFVRNPYARVLSAYLDKIERQGPVAKHIVAFMTEQMKYREGEAISFAMFLRAIDRLAAQGARLDKHWRPLVLHTAADAMLYDFVGRLESFDADCAKLAALLGVDLPAGLDAGLKTRAGEQLSDYYDDECAEIVKRLYKDDFAVFGYDADELGV